jgi:hypothetical protein
MIIMASNLRAACYRFSIDKLDDESIMSLQDIMKDECTFARCQQELSDEGHQHLECVVMFNNYRSCKSVCKLFSVKFAIPIKGRVEIDKAISYCYKDDSKVVDGIEINIGTHHSVDKEQWANKIVNKSFQSVKESMDYIKTVDPKTYILQHKAICAFVNTMYNQTTTSSYLESDFNVPLVDIPDDKTLIFVGPTSVGKTQYALRHFKHPALVTNKEDWRNIVDDTDGIVIDDLATCNFSMHNVLNLVDRRISRTINIKYSSVTINPRIPKIITINNMDYFWPTVCMDNGSNNNFEFWQPVKDAISARIEIKHFDKPLFNKRKELTEYSTIGLVDRNIINEHVEPHIKRQKVDLTSFNRMRIMDTQLRTFKTRFKSMLSDKVKEQVKSLYDTVYSDKIYDYGYMLSKINALIECDNMNQSEECANDPTEVGSFDIIDALDNDDNII